MASETLVARARTPAERTSAARQCIGTSRSARSAITALSLMMAMAMVTVGGAASSSGIDAASTEPSSFASLREQLVARGKLAAHSHSHSQAQAQAHTLAHARIHNADALQTRARRGIISGVMGGAMGSMGIGFAQGRGRGRGRAHMYYGPDEFDDSWWTPPPPVGPDPFMQGYSSHVYPRQQFGYGGMPRGGFGTAHHFWGGQSYKNPSAQPWWRGRGFSSRPRGYGSPYMPYQTPRDSYGMGMFQPGMGANLPVSSPYYYTPPPLQGDWNLPKNPPPPPAEAAAL